MMRNATGCHGQRWSIAHLQADGKCADQTGKWITKLTLKGRKRMARNK